MHRHPQLLAGALVVLLAATACSTDAVSSADGSASASASSPGTAGSAPTGGALDTDALARTVTDEASQLLVPGVVVDLRSPRGELRRAFGSATADRSVPMSLDDHLRIGSNTKTMTGTVVLQLVGQGRVALDDPISKYRPDVPNGANITIEQLLTMTSGLANYTTDQALNRSLDQQPDRAWDPEELLRIAFAEPPAFPPGEGFLYSNTNTVLLGLVAQQLYGKPLPQVFADQLFTPLGLTGTSFPATTDASLPDPHARGYFYGTNEETTTSSVLPDDVQAAARDGRLAPTDVTLTNPSWGWAAGAGISTAADLTTWVRALVGGTTLLPADVQAARLASPKQVNPDDPGSASYGEALAKFGPMYGHTGELPGFNSFMGYDPATDTSLVVWTNLAPSVDGKDPATTIARALIGQVYGS